ncbi:unnamed protein product, partial [Effrenium voratum]
VLPSMPAEGEASRTQSVQETVQGAMSVMQDNMRAMAERDSQLNHLEARTNDLQGASKAFSSGAKRLQRHYQWQRYKLFIVIGGSVLWAVALVLMPRQYFWQFMIITAVIVGVAAVINALLNRREQLKEEAAPPSAELGESLTRDGME